MIQNIGVVFLVEEINREQKVAISDQFPELWDMRKKGTVDHSSQGGLSGACHHLKSKNALSLQHFLEKGKKKKRIKLNFSFTRAESAERLQAWMKNFWRTERNEEGGLTRLEVC